MRDKIDTVFNVMLVFAACFAFWYLTHEFKEAQEQARGSQVPHVIHPSTH